MGAVGEVGEEAGEDAGAERVGAEVAGVLEGDEAAWEA